MPTSGLLVEIWYSQNGAYSTTSLSIPSYPTSVSATAIALPGSPNQDGIAFLACNFYFKNCISNFEYSGHIYK
jgi:hypothetical protein